jgi:hypothetical protein
MIIRWFARYIEGVNKTNQFVVAALCLETHWEKCTVMKTIDNSFPRLMQIPYREVSHEPEM